MESKNCLNCGTGLLGEICHNCGQRHYGKRWSTSVLITQFINPLTNIERGFLYSAIALYRTPGKFISDYWKGVTIRADKPFRMYLDDCSGKVF